ncbi:MAG: hypothetical protein ACI9G9_001007 [Psychromonas sp.]|jgi:hypothetical protein
MLKNNQVRMLTQSQILTLFCILCVSSAFSQLDTTKTQIIQDVEVNLEVRKRVSDLAMHVVDFHFVKGELYTLEKTKTNLKYKIIRDSNVLNLVEPGAKIIRNEYDFHFLQNDSVFVINNRETNYLRDLNAYIASQTNLVGKIDSTFFFHNTHFYRLIDEYTSLSHNDSLPVPFYQSYDEPSFEFLGSHYNDPSHYITLHYNEFHPRFGKRYNCGKNFSMSQFNVEEGQVFKFLEGSTAFRSMVNILTPARTEARIFKNEFFVYDFTNCEVSSYDKTNTRLSGFPIPDIIEDYMHQSAFDYPNNKSYYLLGKYGKYQFLEIDLNTRSYRLLKAPNNILNYYHWEVNDGQLYFLLSDGHLDWQRILYSIRIGDSRY